MNIGLLDSLGSTLGAAGSQLSRLVSCYVRAGAAGGWNYTLVPFSAGAPIPAPVFFTGAAQGVAISQSQGTVSATVDLGAAAANSLAVTIDIVVNTGAIAPLINPRLELVLSPDHTVIASGGSAPTRLSVIVLSLGANSAPVPKHVRLKADLPITGDGISSTATVSARVEAVGVPVTAWLTDGMVTTETGWFGTSLGVNNLPGPLKTALGGLGLILSPILGSDPALSLQRVSQIYTVDTDEATTGSRIDLDVSGTGGAIDIGAVIKTPWAPATRPAVAAQAATPDPTHIYRYMAAVLRPDGTESPPGATSAPVDAASQSLVEVTAPPEPSTGAFAHWRLYRQRLTSAGWSTPILIVDLNGQPINVAADGTHTDTIPTDIAAEQLDESTTTPPVPTDIDLRWGTPQTPVTPAPRPLPIKIRSYDETLSSNIDPESVLTIADLRLPRAGSASLHPNRGAITPLTFHWDADSTPLTLDYQQIRSKTHIHLVLAPLPRVTAAAGLDTADLAAVTWNAEVPTAVSGYVHLPPTILVDDIKVDVPATVSVALHSASEKRAGYPIDVLTLGWIADTVSNLQVRIALTDANTKKTTGTALVVKEMRPNVGVELVLPNRDDPALKADPPLLVDDGQVTVVAGRWVNAPIPGTEPVEFPKIVADSVTPIGQLLMRSAPGTVSVPSPGPGPGIAAVVAQLAEGGSSVAVRVDGLRSLSVQRPAGEIVKFDLRADFAEPQAARLTLTSIAREPVDLPVTATTTFTERFATIQVRVRQIAGPLHESWAWPASAALPHATTMATPVTGRENLPSPCRPTAPRSTACAFSPTQPCETGRRSRAWSHPSAVFRRAHP